MAGAGAEVHEERPIGRHLFQVGDELLGLLGQVGHVVVALLGRLRRLDEVIVIGEPGRPLIDFAAEEAVEAIEAAAERPPLAIAGQVHVLRGRQVPFADRERGPAERRQHFGEEAVGERDPAVGAGEAGRAFGDARHGVGMMIAAGQERRIGSASTGRSCESCCSARRSWRACPCSASCKRASHSNPGPHSRRHRARCRAHSGPPWERGRAAANRAWIRRWCGRSCP